MLRNILMFVFIVICVLTVILVLAQEGKNAGLGTISGSESYWSKHQGRSEEAKKKKATIILVIAFFILAVILNLNF